MCRLNITLERMNKLPLIFLLLVCHGLANAQTYYVAIVHGTVSYNGVPLKPKSKITATGELRFATKEDYVKVSGPGGIHTLKPEKQVPSSSEFFTALSDELFPKIRMRGSFANSFTSNNADPYFFSFGSAIWDGATFSLREMSEDRMNDLVFAYEKEDGIIVSVPATIRKNELVLEAATFGQDAMYPVWIVLVEDAAGWAKSVSTSEEVDSLDVFSHSLLRPANPDEQTEGTRVATSLRGYVPTGTSGILLGTLNPSSILTANKKLVFKDLRRQVKWIRPASAWEFFDDFEMESFYEEEFGLYGIPGDMYDYVKERIEKLR